MLCVDKVHCNTQLLRHKGANTQLPKAQGPEGEVIKGHWAVASGEDAWRWVGCAVQVTGEPGQFKQT